MKKLILGVERWLGERLPMESIKEFTRKQAGKPLPPHTSWFHTFGSLSLFLFANQIITGILLMVYYRPTTKDAFESIRFITTSATFGWLIRGLHSWGATLMILMLLLHMTRTFFMGAYKKPRELTWVIGVLLFGLTLTFGFTGYLLPWNQLSYYATTVGTNIIGAIPLVGEPLRHLFLGGNSVGSETLARFYVLHVVVLPWVLVFLVALHIVLMRTQGLATLDRVGEEVKPDHKTGLPFFPDHVLKELSLFAIFLGFMITLVVLLPAELGEKVNPLKSEEGIKPEWYFLPTYQLIKYFPELLGLFVSVIPTMLLLLWPFIDRTPERRFSKRPVSVSLGIAAIVLALLFGILGYFADREVTIFGKRYFIDHYGIPQDAKVEHQAEPNK